MPFQNASFQTLSTMPDLFVRAEIANGSLPLNVFAQNVAKADWWGTPTMLDVSSRHGQGISRMSLRWGRRGSQPAFAYDAAADVLAASVAGCTDLLVGLTHFGGIAVWAYSSAKSALLDWRAAGDGESRAGDGGRAAFKMREAMKKYAYRYVFLFGGGGARGMAGGTHEEASIVYVGEQLSDGTYDKLGDGGLLRYHEAAKPRRLAVRWRVGKAGYAAYFRFDGDRLQELFDRFYGAHPDTRADFIVRIDAERGGHGLSLYRYGLQQPMAVPAEAYELIVFKNRLEHYRSANYSQGRGAWIW